MGNTTFVVDELDCAAEESTARSRLARLGGVESIAFDILNRRLTVTHTLPNENVIIEALREVGLTASPFQRTSSLGQIVTGTPSSSERPSLATPSQIIRLSLSGVLALGAEATAWAGVAESTLAVIAMAAASIVLGGLPTLSKGLIALRTFTLNINFLMTIAVIGACAIGEWPEAAVVVFLFAIAELIERFSLERARNALRAIMTMAPEVASIKQPDGSWIEVAVENVSAGSVVRVKPGERFPLDGRVNSGHSAVNQAPITGESIPVEKTPGALVFAGTINGEGLIELRTTGGKDETTIARIIRTVQGAQTARAPTQRFVDAFARVYTPVVCALAFVLAILPPLVFGQSWYPWLYQALVLLVIACPCALVISTPVTVVSGLTAAARRGILIKGGVYLEGGRKLRAIALDKTGTITEGRPKLTDVVPLGRTRLDDVLRLAASLDAGSDHPVARAVFAAWDDEKIATLGPLLPVQYLTSVTGRGVEGTINGEKCFVGNHRLAEERGVCSSAIEDALSALEAQGKTAIVVTRSREVIGVLAVADTPRETSVVQDTTTCWRTEPYCWRPSQHRELPCPTPMRSGSDHHSAFLAASAARTILSPPKMEL